MMTLLRCFSWLLANLIVLPAAAGLTVIADLGGVSTAPYFESLAVEEGNSAPSASELRSPISPAAPSLSRPVTSESMLPVRSRVLTPGAVNVRNVELPGMTPLFLIGDDDLSHRWLAARLSVLQQLGATGLVVNVESVGAWRALQARAPGLTLSPVSGDDLARRLGLTHYPVLITAERIEQ
ncbi:integrating conjugative element protein [Serratia fonticola]